MSTTNAALKAVVVLYQAVWLRQQFEVLRHQQQLEQLVLRQELQQLQGSVEAL